MRIDDNSVIFIHDNSVIYQTKIDDRNVIPCNYKESNCNYYKRNYNNTALRAEKNFLTERNKLYQG